MNEILENKPNTFKSIIPSDLIQDYNELVKHLNLGLLEEGKIYKLGSDNLSASDSISVNVYSAFYEIEKLKEDIVCIEVIDGKVFLLGKVMGSESSALTFLISPSHTQFLYKDEKGRLDDEFEIKVDKTTTWAKIAKKSGNIFVPSVHDVYKKLFEFHFANNPLVDCMTNEWNMSTGFNTNTEKYFENKKLLIDKLSTKDEFLEYVKIILSDYRCLDRYLVSLTENWNNRIEVVRLIQEISALSTWTGRQIDGLGFSDSVTVSDDEQKGKVNAFFYKRQD